MLLSTLHVRSIYDIGEDLAAAKYYEAVRWEDWLNCHSCVSLLSVCRTLAPQVVTLRFGFMSCQVCWEEEVETRDEVA